MQIKLSNPRGFCAGVRVAIEIVDELLDVMDEDEHLYVYHEIVHNRHVVQRLKERGAVFVENIQEVPEGSLVVFSAHGVSPAIKKEADSRSLNCIDATCPLVIKVHAEAIRYAKRGWQILLIGHRNHQEIIGTLGEAPNSIQIVETPEDIQTLSIINPAKLVYLTQTTLSIDDANIIIDALKENFPEIHSPPSDDICYATTNRQLAVRDNACKVDLVLVVGSNNSSNSVRLTEISESSGTTSYLIDDVTMLQSEWFDNVSKVLVTAGASAPEHLVTELVEYLIQHFDGKLVDNTNVNEGMYFSKPQSLTNYLKKKSVTIEGKEQ